jgi:hypothetical protein
MGFLGHNRTRVVYLVLFEVAVWITFIAAGTRWNFPDVTVAIPPALIFTIHATRVLRRRGYLYFRAR